MLNSTHTFVSPNPTTLERYLLELESSMSESFVSEYSCKDLHRLLYLTKKRTKGSEFVVVSLLLSFFSCFSFSFQSVTSARLNRLG